MNPLSDSSLLMRQPGHRHQSSGPSRSAWASGKRDPVLGTRLFGVGLPGLLPVMQCGCPWQIWAKFRRGHLPAASGLHLDRQVGAHAPSAVLALTQVGEVRASRASDICDARGPVLIEKLFEVHGAMLAIAANRVNRKITAIALACVQQ